MSDKQNVTRRKFIELTGKGAAVLAAAPAILRGAGPTADPVRVGHIGIGVRGGTLITWTGVAKSANVVAVCDVYKPHLEKAVALSRNPEVKTYTDYRELLADPNVEAVVIAAPDHWHCKMVLDACAAGKAVYCEKGWSHTLDQAKLMRAAVRKSNTVMQLGHQGRQLASAIQARDLIQDGALGHVHLVHTGRYTNRPMDQNIWRWYGWYSNYDRPDPKQVAKDVDWERWLGDRPKIDFNERHFWHWRCYWRYGTGHAGDLLSHELDFVQSVLRYGVPDTCSCTGLNALLHDDREVPDTWNVVYQFEKQGCTVTFDSTMNSAELGQPPEFRGKDALIRFNSIGQSANTFDVHAERSSPKYEKLLTDKKIKRGEPFQKFDPKKTPRQPEHMEDFLICVRTGDTPKCNVDEAFIETATFLMSVESYKQKRQVRWDPEKEEIV